MQHHFETIADVEAFAAQQGIALSPADRAKIAQTQAAERERLTAIEPQAAVSRSWVDNWNRFYPRLLESIVTIGETVLTVSQTVIVALGVPVVLVLLLIVEHTRVMHGIQLFEVNYHLASFAAWALVMLNLVLEFTVHHVEHRAGYESSRSRRWSLRLWASNMAYRLGLGENWQAVDLSPAERYRRLLRLVTFTILALALAGSMRDVIAQQQGAWYEALVHIVTASTLAEITVWTGGLLFAAAAVLSAQGLSRYVAIRVVEIAAQSEARQTEDVNPYAAEIDRAGAMVALAIVQDRLAKQAAKAKPTSAPATNGNGHQENPDFLSAPPVYIANGNGRPAAATGD